MEHIHNICIYKYIHTFIYVYIHVFPESSIYVYMYIYVCENVHSCHICPMSSKHMVTQRLPYKIRAFSDAPDLSTNQCCCLASLPYPKCRSDSSFYLRHRSGSCFFLIILNKCATVNVTQIKLCNYSQKKFVSGKLY